MSLSRRLAHFLRVVGVTALSTNSEPLQQAKRRIIPALACQLAVLGELLLNSSNSAFLTIAGAGISIHCCRSARFAEYGFLGTSALWCWARTRT